MLNSFFINEEKTSTIEDVVLLTNVGKIMGGAYVKSKMEIYYKRKEKEKNAVNNQKEVKFWRHNEERIFGKDNTREIYRSKEKQGKAAGKLLDESN